MNDLTANTSKISINNNSNSLELITTKVVDNKDVNVANLKIPGELENILNKFEIRMKEVLKTNQNEFIRLAER